MSRQTSRLTEERNVCESSLTLTLGGDKLPDSHDSHHPQYITNTHHNIQYQKSLIRADHNEE